VICNRTFVIPRNRFSVGPVVPGVLQSILQTFGGTERWDRWDHHGRVPCGQHRPVHAGPTQQYHLLAPKSSVVPPVRSVPPVEGLSCLQQ
jgi:hypothetical protein